MWECPRLHREQSWGQFWNCGKGLQAIRKGCFAALDRLGHGYSTCKLEAGSFERASFQGEMIELPADAKAEDLPLWHWETLCDLVGLWFTYYVISEVVDFSSFWKASLWNTEVNCGRRAGASLLSCLLESFPSFWVSILVHGGLTPQNRNTEFAVRQDTSGSI